MSKPSAWVADDPSPYGASDASPVAGSAAAVFLAAAFLAGFFALAFLAELEEAYFVVSFVFADVVFFAEEPDPEPDPPPESDDSPSRRFLAASTLARSAATRSRT